MHAERLSPAAYWAAWADALPVLQQRCPEAVERCLQELKAGSKAAAPSPPGCRGCRRALRGPRMGPAARLGSVSTNSGAASGAQGARRVGKWLAKGCCSRTPHFFPRAGSAAGHSAQRPCAAACPKQVHMQGQHLRQISCTLRSGADCVSLCLSHEPGVGGKERRAAALWFSAARTHRRWWPPRVSSG